MITFQVSYQNVNNSLLFIHCFYHVALIYHFFPSFLETIVGITIIINILFFFFFLVVVLVVEVVPVLVCV